MMPYYVPSKVTIDKFCKKHIIQVEYLRSKKEELQYFIPYVEAQQQ